MMSMYNYTQPPGGAGGARTRLPKKGVLRGKRYYMLPCCITGCLAVLQAVLLYNRLPCCITGDPAV